MAQVTMSGWKFPFHDRMAVRKLRFDAVLHDRLSVSKKAFALPMLLLVVGSLGNCARTDSNSTLRGQSKR